ARPRQHRPGAPASGPLVGLSHQRRPARRQRALPARDRVRAADDRHGALRRGPLQDLTDRRDRAGARRADQAHGAGRGRGARAAADRRAAPAAPELAARGGVGWRDVAQAVHGTTLGSNVVIERKARGVGLLTTRGFRDVLIIGREKRYQVYDLQIEKPAPLIPRRFIGEVTERILADGAVRTPLDEADACRAIRELVARGVTTLAICLLHAYLNPVHEKRLAALVSREAPHVTVTMSHEVSPTFREYERTSTTVVNAYVMTAIREYLRGLAAAIGERGYRGRLFVMQSSGGVATAEAMQRYPVRMIESGP